MTVYRTNAGKYRHPITIQKLKSVRDTYGEIDPDNPLNWENVLSTRAGIFPISGKDYYDAHVINAELTHKIQLRYVKGIDSTMRIKFGSRIFEMISPPIDFQEKHIELMLMCKERNVPQTGVLNTDG